MPLGDTQCSCQNDGLNSELILVSNSGKICKDALSERIENATHVNLNDKYLAEVK